LNNGASASIELLSEIVAIGINRSVTAISQKYGRLRKIPSTESRLDSSMANDFAGGAWTFVLSNRNTTARRWQKKCQKKIVLDEQKQSRIMADCA
jgi:hypothetical protein